MQFLNGLGVFAFLLLLRGTVAADRVYQLRAIGTLVPETPNDPVSFKFLRMQQSIMTPAPELAIWLNDTGRCIDNFTITHAGGMQKGGKIIDQATGHKLVFNKHSETIPGNATLRGALELRDANAPSEDGVLDEWTYTLNPLYNALRVCGTTDGVSDCPGPTGRTTVKWCPVYDRERDGYVLHLDERCALYGVELELYDPENHWDPYWEWPEWEEE